jgi:hypothetical protein
MPLRSPFGRADNPFTKRGGRGLLLSAGSQDQKFLDAKNPIRPEDMRDAVILKLPL